MYDKERIYNYLREELVALFELEPEQIQPQANLFEDLDIDSIDAVDLMVKLKAFTGKRIDPMHFKQVRTVQDVVDAVYHLVQQQDGEVEGGSHYAAASVEQPRG